MGGVTASFAMLGDIIIAEPGALVGFAGERVIEGTIHEKLPEDFRRAEMVQGKGFADLIVSRQEQKKMLAYLIDLHAGAGK
jgi:acetyl-CoA carboxylase carboxyl transferase subunit beta